MSKKQAKTAKALALDLRLPALGTTIEKHDRHGAVRCKCTVEEGGIRYSGKVYTSLSGAAMAAAKDLDLKNKTQNGYIFWGLIKPPRPASDPLVALERAWERYRNRVETLVKEGVGAQWELRCRLARTDQWVRRRSRAQSARRDPLQTLR
jgi:hypothetical protein